MDDQSLLKKSRELRSIPAGVHWFCPRLSNDDTNTYDDRDSTGVHPDAGVDHDSEVQRNITASKHRTEASIACLKMLAFDSEETAPFNEWYSRQLDLQMKNCHICVRNYHLGKRKLIESLREEHEDEDVTLFSKALAGLDLRRIRPGLAEATTMLRASPAETRGVTSLDTSSLCCIFEALSADAVLKDPHFIQTSFDEPFRLLQTRRPLRITDYVPAMGSFLFDKDSFKVSWAARSWSRMKKNITSDEFGWIVQDPLLAAMHRATQTPNDAQFSYKLWSGIRLIVDRLDKAEITHSLRALDQDIYRFALDQMQLDSAPLQIILQTLTALLIKSPEDFWSAMGAISPTALVEMICNQASFVRILTAADPNIPHETSPLADALRWIDPFVASLKPANQPSACRAFTAQLIERFQVETFPEHTRLHCFHSGLTVMGRTLRSFVDQKTLVDRSVGRVVVSELMEVVCKHASSIVAVTALPQSEDMNRKLASAALDVIRNTLALDCQCVKTDYDTLLSGASLDQGTGSYSLPIWKAVADGLDRNHLVLAQHVLRSIMGQVGLEKLSLKVDAVKKKDRILFNDAYGQVVAAIAKIFDRLSDFDPLQLDRLYADRQTSYALIAGFFASDTAIYEGALDVAKIVSAQLGRKEALKHLLTAFFDSSMNSLAWTVRRIAHRRTFACHVHMLKTCGDVLDLLCDAQDGSLRTRAFTSEDKKLVDSFWSFQWQALTGIFSTAEAWGTNNEKGIMREFCRDTMQFAERLFDSYNSFAKAIGTETLTDATPTADALHDQAKTERKLLEQPRLTMNTIVRWLRLRDEYLAMKSVTLICSILRRLGAAGMAVAEPPFRYIIEVAVAGTVKTALNASEKAELNRALEEHQQGSEQLAHIRIRPSSSSPSSDEPKVIREAPSREPDKRTDRTSADPKGSIDLESWRAKTTTETGVKVGASANHGDIEIKAASSSLELFKAQQAARHQSKQVVRARQKLPRGAIPLPPVRRAIPLPPGQAQASFKLQREKEKLEKARRDKEQIARLKGKLVGSDPVANQGSAVNGLGVRGKDHAPRNSDLMVSSDSETEEDDDEDGDLDRAIYGVPDAASRKLQEYREGKLRAMQQAQQRGPTKKMKLYRNSRDMRARLAPDLSTLHREILGWDIFDDGRFPPKTGRDNYTLVSNSFNRVSDYQGTFKSLLLLEAWQGFLKAKEENNLRIFELKIASRLSVDSFIEISSSMTMTEGKDLGIGEADVVLISKGRSPMKESQQEHCLARVFKINRKKGSMEISYRMNAGQAIVPSMSQGSSFKAVKITSMTPLEREYGALQALQYYDLCNEIIKANPSPLLSYTDKQLDPIVENYKLNRAQARAVKSAIDNDAFTLIQGPPGSGKTSTIVAIVGALLTPSLADHGVSIPRPQNVNGVTGRPAQVQPASKKLLVCAPSNAAVDELVMRLKQGVKTTHGQVHKVSIVRLGRSDAINAKVVDVTLEELVNKKLGMNNEASVNNGDEIHKRVEEMRSLGEALNETREKLEEARKRGEPAAALQRQFDGQKRERALAGNKIDELRDKSSTAARDAEINRRRVQQSIIDGAHIICATLSGSGHEMFQNLNIEFDTVVIDEAAQSVELSALIPLKYGCTKCILVGDPKQLPPTVLSREAAQLQYEQSLFVRMQLNHPSDVHLLDTQYRMHPDISVFPSRIFYDGLLVDGPDMAALRNRPWHASSLLAPYRFFDVKGAHQRAPRGHSLINVAELNVALQLYDRLITDYRGYDFTGKVGIITPYKSQLRELKMRFRARYGESIFDTIEFNTTDAFQGRESEVIIFSCVRASPGGGIGFLDDIRRMNVGLTRAKSSLWVLGNAQSLYRDEFWGRLVDDCRQRNCYTEGDVMALLQRPTVERDYEMPDVGAASDVQHTSKVLEKRDDAVMANVPEPDYKGEAETPLTHRQVTSGGKWGPDSSRCCTTCGSSEHTSSNCDKQAPKAAKAKRCARCRSLDHTVEQCEAVRCDRCGENGHRKTSCSSAEAMSSLEKDAWAQAEHAIVHGNREPPEATRRKNLGDHDPKVPSIRVTRKTPPLNEHGVVSKRMREPSPPGNAKRAQLDHSKATQPGVGAGAGANPPAGSTPAVPRRVAPPVRRKKEVNPFIIPKRRTR
ncbi:MAG: hypothetical protein M1825_002604 [Sarcosagium campestre]|nr:MAG: hypothetical protein M1825_002604 [Sarcosagium campestre]